MPFESEFHQSVRSGNKLIHAWFALLVSVFVTETYKLMFQAGWVSIPGGAIVGYVMVTGVVVAGLLMTGSPKRVYLWNEMGAAIRDDRPFLFFYLSLVLLGFGIWLSDTSADSLLLIDIVKSLLTCISTMLLVRLCYHMRHGWRIYLGIGFVVYCLSIWVDALWPGTFTEIAGLGNPVSERQVVSGINHDPNSGSYIVIFLSVALLSYRRFRVIDLSVLSFATLTVLLTLSRSGLFILVLIAICYASLTIVNSLGRRWFVAGSFATAAVITVFCGWTAIRLIEHFETPKARIAVGQLLIQDEWFRTRLSASNEDLIQAHLQDLEPFGQVNAPKAPELMFLDRERVALAASNSLSLEEVRSYITYVDGGEYVHIESRRMARLRNALDAIAESPWIGHGIGFNRNAGISAHNMFLAMWIDFGLLGLILYAAPLVIGFLKFYRSKYWLGTFFMLGFSAISIFIQHIFTLYTAFFVMGLVLSLKPKVATEAKLSVE